MPQDSPVPNQTQLFGSLLDHVNPHQSVVVCVKLCKKVI